MSQATDDESSATGENSDDDTSSFAANSFEKNASLGKTSGHVRRISSRFRSLGNVSGSLVFIELPSPGDDPGQSVSSIRLAESETTAAPRCESLEQRIGLAVREAAEYMEILDVKSFSKNAVRKEAPEPKLAIGLERGYFDEFYAPDVKIVVALTGPGVLGMSHPRQRRVRIQRTGIELFANGTYWEVWQPAVSEEEQEELGVEDGDEGEE